MRAFFRPNITLAGRIVRALIAVVILIGGIILLKRVTWLSILMFVASAFVFFEALRGWCLARACGIKTRL